MTPGIFFLIVVTELDIDEIAGFDLRDQLRPAPFVAERLGRRPAVGVICDFHAGLEEIFKFIAPAAEAAFFLRIFARLEIAARMERRITGEKNIGRKRTV